MIMLAPAFLFFQLLRWMEIWFQTVTMVGYQTVLYLPVLSSALGILLKNIITCARKTFGCQNLPHYLRGRHRIEVPQLPTVV